MGKQGPCGHCGIATTPLWRNGPPEKPVLCNACGSRWRTKGTLLNYMPMHSGGFGGSASPEGKKISPTALSEQRSYKRKEPCGGHHQTGPLRPFSKSAADDSDSESSLSSSMSDSDDDNFAVSSPVQIDTAADSSPPWEGRVPCRKRTSMARACTSVDKLIRQFQDLVYEDSPARSSLTSESAEDVLVDSKPSTMTDEIGLGSIFIRQPMLQEYRSESFIDPEGPNSLDMFPLYSGFGRNGHFSSTAAAAENVSEKENLDTGSSFNDGGFVFETQGSCRFDDSGLPPIERIRGIDSAEKDDLPDLDSPGVETEADLLFDNSSSMMSLQENGFIQQTKSHMSKEDPDENEVENTSLVNNIWHMESNPAELFWNPISTGPGQSIPTGAILNPGRLLIG